MFRAIQHNSARSYVWTMAGLEMVVERKADVVSLQEPPRERTGIGLSHPAYEIRERKRVWMVVRKGSGPITNA